MTLCRSVSSNDEEVSEQAGLPQMLQAVGRDYAEGLKIQVRTSIHETCKATWNACHLEDHSRKSTTATTVQDAYVLKNIQSDLRTV